MPAPSRESSTAPSWGDSQSGRHSGLGSGKSDTDSSGHWVG